MGFSRILAEFAEKFGWPKIRRKKIRLAENPPKKSVSRPNIIKKFGWWVYWVSYEEYSYNLVYGSIERIELVRRKIRERKQRKHFLF